MIPLDAEGGATPAVKAVSPGGTVPYLEHRGNAVWESLAICEYCAEQAPGLWPADWRRPARMRAWIGGRDACGLPRVAHGDADEAVPAGNGRRPDRGVAGRRGPHRRDLARDACPVRRGRRVPVRGGGFGNADAMFAPVVARFLTYRPPLSPKSEAYCAAVRVASADGCMVRRGGGRARALVHRALRAGAGLTVPARWAMVLPPARDVLTTQGAGGSDQPARASALRHIGRPIARSCSDRRGVRRAGLPGGAESSRCGRPGCRAPPCTALRERCRGGRCAPSGRRWSRSTTGRISRCSWPGGFPSLPVGLYLKTTTRRGCARPAHHPCARRELLARLSPVVASSTWLVGRLLDGIDTPPAGPRRACEQPRLGAMPPSASDAGPRHPVRRPGRARQGARIASCRPGRGAAPARLAGRR